MKKSTLILFISFSIILSSQELDEDYLNSLPSDIRADVIDNIEANEEIEKPVYRRASTVIDKEEDDDEIEPMLFGSKFFDTIQSSFMPINEPNLDSSYILDFGDVIEIQLIGQKSSLESYLIERDGSININDIGKIFISGLSLNDASDFIKSKISNSYIGTDAYISLTNIRDINIIIAGNAFNPGIYTLNGNSNMLHALNMAGGINEIGSYRKIDLIRNGKVIDTLDIYQLLVNGIHNNTGLRTGDSIVVRPLTKLISIESGVMRPMRYELLPNENFSDLLNYANGFSKNSDLSNIIIKRIVEGNSKVLTIDLSDIYNFEFLDNDSVFIREHKFKNVTIEGAIKNPGNYILADDNTLSDLIKTAGGYEDSAYPFGGYLENKRALLINTEARQKLYDSFVSNIIRNPNTSSSDQNNVELLLQQIADAEVTGRVIAEFDIDVIANDPKLDTLLEDGDRIIIPNITQQVYLHGEISNPGAIRYMPGEDVDYYLSKAGGALNNADLDKIFIVHPNGETNNLNAYSSLSFLKADNSINLIYPGSIIYVPQSTDFASSLQVASIWAPIISSIALSLTSLSVLNNNN